MENSADRINHLFIQRCNQLNIAIATVVMSSSINHTGVGDTFGTCFGPLSRNRKFGYRLGKGETMEEILASTTEVAEGVETSKALVKMIKARCKGYRLDLKYPILFGVANILEGKQTPEEGLKGLMNMPMRMESFDERTWY